MEKDEHRYKKNYCSKTIMKIFSSRKLRKVKYCNNDVSKFDLSLSAYLKICLINLKLDFIRFYRRCKRIISYLKNILLIIPLWTIYAFAVYYIEQKNGHFDTLLSITWDARKEIFSTVFLVGISSVVTNYRRDKGKYRIQHNIYKEVMSALSEICKELIHYIYNDFSKDQIPYWPLYYCDDIYKEITERCREPINKTNSSFSLDRLKLSLTKAGQQIGELTRYNDNGLLLDCDYCKLDEIIGNVSKELTNIEYDFIQADLPKTNTASVRLMSFAEESYGLLEIIRYPWRRDIKDKIRILSIIEEENPKVEKNYYHSAYIGDIDYKFYAMTIEEIVEYVRKNYLNFQPISKSV